MPRAMGEENGIGDIFLCDEAAAGQFYRGMDDTTRDAIKAAAMCASYISPQPAHYLPLVLSR